MHQELQEQQFKCCISIQISMMKPCQVFPLRPASELENSQTYILKPLQRHAWITLNEKQSYLFTTTLIGLKVFIVRIIHEFLFQLPTRK